MLRAVLGGNVAAGLSSRPALGNGVDETIEAMMKGRDIAVLGKGLKVGLWPTLQQMAMCGSDGEDGHPGRLQGLRSFWSSATVRSITSIRSSRRARSASRASRTSAAVHRVQTIIAPKKTARPIWTSHHLRSALTCSLMDGELMLERWLGKSEQGG